MTYTKLLLFLFLLLLANSDPKTVDPYRKIALFGMAGPTPNVMKINNQLNVDDFHKPNGFVTNMHVLTALPRLLVVPQI